MQLLEPILLFTGLVVSFIAVDWHLRGASDRRMRRLMHAQVQSYLRTPKRI
jgi:hypothetical protein